VRVAIAIMVVIIPVAVGAPPVLMFVPPTMVAGPAALARLVQLGAPMIGLPAVVAMMLDCLMQLMIGFPHAPLTVIVIGS
jgi:hypothetical protein